MTYGVRRQRQHPLLICSTVVPQLLAVRQGPAGGEGSTTALTQTLWGGKRCAQQVLDITYTCARLQIGCGTTVIVAIFTQLWKPLNSWTWSTGQQSLPYLYGGSQCLLSNQMCAGAAGGSAAGRAR